MRHRERRVNPPFLILAGMILCLGYGLSQGGEQPQNGGVPVLVVDHEHWAIERKDGVQALQYRIRPAPRIILDATQYEFQIPAALRGIDGPNMIMVVAGNGEYGMAWREKKKYTLTSETLRPLKGSQPFEGFRSGDKGAIVIGHVGEEATTEKSSDFDALWSAVFVVQ